MRAFTSTTWAIGLTYRNSVNTMLGSWAAYGTADTLSYLYGGVYYADNTLRIYPATDRVGIGPNVVPAYTLDVTGSARVTGSIFGGGMEAPTVKATTSFYRDNTAGTIYVPVTPFTMYDTNNSGWGGASRVAGTYYFDVQQSQNGLPANVRAICIFLQGAWAATSNANYAYLEGEQQVLVGVIRAHTTYTQETQAIVAVKQSDGYFHVVVGGATMTGGLVRCVGYFL